MSQIASEHGIHINQLSNWRQLVLDYLPSVFEKETRDIQDLKNDYDSKIDDLYAEIGRLTAELSIMKRKSGIES